MGVARVATMAIAAAGLSRKSKVSAVMRNYGCLWRDAQEPAAVQHYDSLYFPTFLAIAFF
jgi:hypothetical protein